MREDTEQELCYLLGTWTGLGEAGVHNYCDRMAGISAVSYRDILLAWRHHFHTCGRRVDFRIGPPAALYALLDENELPNDAYAENRAKVEKWKKAADSMIEGR